MKAIDCVLHLAGESDPEPDIETLLELNIKGTYNVLEAAFHTGVKKVIIASSIHTKCFIEALASYYGFEKGLKSIAIRIVDIMFLKVEVLFRIYGIYLLGCHPEILMI